MDIRHNGQFYRNSGKITVSPQTLVDSLFDIDAVMPTNASNKILLRAYKELMQNFNELEMSDKTKWQLEINIIARQLSHLFKQAMKGASYTGYPALSLLKEIKQLDEKLTAGVYETID